MTDQSPPNPSESLQQSIGSRETIAPTGLDSTPTGSGPFASLPVAFGRFEVRKLLGRGAMGTVYLAFDPEMNKQVALKIPKFQVADDPTLLERFWREAQATGAMNHPNICGMYEVGEIAGTHFISMEYIDGRPLADYIGPDQPQRQVAAIVRKLAQGLAHAHELGFIHRDLKPSNVMIAADGQPKIMDFGLTLRFGVTGDIRLTQSNTIVGSPAYMSPEQARSENTLTPASDIYSLGTLFFELLTGELPFQGPMAVVLGRIALQKVPKLSTVRPDVDPRLEALCLKMLEKKPAARPQSMTEVADTLTGWLKGGGTSPEIAVSPAVVSFAASVVTPLTPKKPASSPVAAQADFLTEQQQRVTDLLDERQYGPAIELLEKITNLRDAKFEKLVAWAKLKLKEVRATDQKLREASAPSCDTARQLLRHYDYAGVVQVLEQVPSVYRSLELRDLLEEATNARDECDHLQRDIEAAVRTGDTETLPALVKRLYKLKPNNKAIKQLAADLKEYGAAKVIARRKGQRRFLDSNERAFETKHIVGSVVLVIGLFVGVSLLVQNYLATSRPSEPMKAPEQVAKNEVIKPPMQAASVEPETSPPLEQMPVTTVESLPTQTVEPAEPSRTSNTAAAPATVTSTQSTAPSDGAKSAISLFDGKTLKGWHGNSAHWSVKDGAIIGRVIGATPGGSFLVSDKTYGDFTLRLKFRLVEGNSGVQIRSVEQPKYVVSGPQADIAFHDNFKFLGCLTGERFQPAMIATTTEATKTRLRETVYPAGWNEMTVSATGQTVVITINEQVTVNVTSDKLPQTGVIALQLHGGGPRTTVEFKNIEVTTAAESAAMNAKDDGAKSTISLFDGKTLNGWEAIPSSARPQWIVRNGVLTNLPNSPSLSTKGLFNDFDLHLEFKLPPKCNTGVYLRGRYEVALLDSAWRSQTGQPAPPVAQTGAIWGLIAPSKNVYNGANTWNSLDVRLAGRIVTVRLNDTTIINAKPISKVTGGAFDDKESEPGPIVLQSHQVTGAEFRNITIKPLP